MPVDDVGVVDAVGFPLSGDDVALTISDHLDWKDVGEHLLILQEKLNRYFAFVEAGELFERFPAAVDKAIWIDVVFKHTPPPDAETFLEAAKEASEQADCGLRWRVFAE